jgi:hypothetical protein
MAAWQADIRLLPHSEVVAFLDPDGRGSRPLERLDPAQRDHDWWKEVLLVDEFEAVLDRLRSRMPSWSV